MTKPPSGPKTEQLMKKIAPPGARIVLRRGTGELSAARIIQPERDVPDNSAALIPRDLVSH